MVGISAASVWGSRVQGLGLGLQGLGVRVLGSGFRVRGFRDSVRVQGIKVC